MFKKNSNQITMDMQKIYSVYDSVSKQYRGTFYHSTDAEMIKVSLPSLLMEFPLRDISIYCVGYFDPTTGDIKPCHHVKIPLDSYTFPHSRLSSKGDDLTLDEVATEMQKTKNEMIAKMGERTTGDVQNENLEKGDKVNE